MFQKEISYNVGPPSIRSVDLFDYNFPIGFMVVITRVGSIDQVITRGPDIVV